MMGCGYYMRGSEEKIVRGSEKNVMMLDDKKDMQI
jgi:hypothetical protein